MSDSPAPLALSAQPALEELLSVQQAADLMRVCRRTIKNYYLYGHRGVYLRTVMVGAKRYTTREWIGGFIARVSAKDYGCTVAASMDDCEGVNAPSTTAAIETAREHLRSIGVLPADHTEPTSTEETET